MMSLDFFSCFFFDDPCIRFLDDGGQSEHTPLDLVLEQWRSFNEIDFSFFLCFMFSVLDDQKESSLGHLYQ